MQRLYGKIVQGWWRMRRYASIMRGPIVTCGLVLSTAASAQYPVVARDTGAVMRRVADDV